MAIFTEFITFAFQYSYLTYLQFGPYRKFPNYLLTFQKFMTKIPKLLLDV